MSPRLRKAGPPSQMPGSCQSAANHTFMHISYRRRPAWKEGRKAFVPLWIHWKLYLQHQNVKSLKTVMLACLEIWCFSSTNFLFVFSICLQWRKPSLMDPKVSCDLCEHISSICYLFWLNQVDSYKHTNSSPTNGISILPFYREI